MKKAAYLMSAFAALAFGTAVANAQTPDATAASSASALQLSAVDDNFIAQTPFQIDSGRLAEKKGTTAAIRDYAHLMVVSHIPVVNALNAILQRKNMAVPPNTLLHGAYNAMVASLEADRGIGFDMSKGKSNIKKETPRSSNTRPITGPTRTSRNSRAKLCRRSKIICTERSPWQKAVIAPPLSDVNMPATRTALSGSKQAAPLGCETIVTLQTQKRRCAEGALLRQEMSQPFATLGAIGDRRESLATNLTARMYGGESHTLRQIWPASVLSLVDIERPALRSGEVLVEIKASAINPSDVRNVAGAF